MKKTFLILIIVFSFIFYSCASNIYTISQLQHDEKLHKKILNKQVRVWKTNDESIYGYLEKMNTDSVTIVLKNKKNEQPMMIANHEIRSITVEQDAEPALAAGIVFVIVILVLAAKGLGEGISKTK